MKIIPKNWCFDLTSRWNCLHLLWSRFTPFASLFWLFLHIRFEIMNPCFIHGYESTQKTRLKHPQNAVFVPLWANAAPILCTPFSCPNFQSICDVQHFLKCLSCLLARALLDDGHPIPFCGFSSPFLWWSPHLADDYDNCFNKILHWGNNKIRCRNLFSSWLNLLQNEIPFELKLKKDF